MKLDLSEYQNYSVNISSDWSLFSQTSANELAATCGCGGEKLQQDGPAREMISLGRILRVDDGDSDRMSEMDCTEDVIFDDRM